MASARIVPVLLALMSLALAGGDEGPLPRLVVTTADGVVLVDAPLPDDRAWRMEWVHSVARVTVSRSEEHTSELQSRENLVCRLLLEKKKANIADIQHDESDHADDAGAVYAV